MVRNSRGVFLNILNGDRKDWERQFVLFRDLHLDHVELLCEHLLTEDDIAFLLNLLGPVAVNIHAPYVGVSLASHDDDLRKASVARIAKFAHMTERLNAGVVTVHSGAVGVWESADAVGRLADSLLRLRPSFPGKLALENMPVRGGGTRELVARREDVQSVLAIIPDMSFTLDVGHVLQNGESVRDWLEVLGNALLNIHLHDGRSAGSGHVALGSGDLDLGDLLLAIGEYGFSGSIALETISVEDTKLSWKSWSASERVTPLSKP